MSARGQQSRTRICSFELDPRGFVCARLDAGAVMHLEDARECVAEMWQAAKQRRRPVLVDMSELGGEDRAAREYFVSDEAVAKYAAVAILVRSPVSRVIGTFFLRLARHKAPTRLFTSEAEAVHWLEGQIA